MLILLDSDLSHQLSLVLYCWNEGKQICNKYKTLFNVSLWTIVLANEAHYKRMKNSMALG